MSYSQRGVRFKPWNLPPTPSETELELTTRRHRAYFDWQLNEIVPNWWKKIPAPDFSEMRVIDLGCGHGALAVDIARRGAAYVLGVDVDSERIDFARRNVENSYPELASRIEFLDQDLASVIGEFDVVVSKDTFEHIQDLRGTVREIHRLLRSGGKLVVGFSPLYFSPFGDHGRYLGSWSRLFPWVQVYMPEALLLQIARWRTGHNYNATSDLGLNKLTPAKFRALFDSTSWEMHSMTYNPGDKALLKTMRVLRELPLLEPFFTTGIYAIVSKIRA